MHYHYTFLGMLLVFGLVVGLIGLYLAKREAAAAARQAPPSEPLPHP